MYVVTVTHASSHHHHYGLVQLDDNIAQRLNEWGKEPTGIPQCLIQKLLELYLLLPANNLSQSQ